MIAAGYISKRVETKTDWLKPANVDAIYSVSGCISRPFCDYIEFWRHNGFWFFDSLSVIQELADEDSISLEGTTPFFYKVFPKQWVPEEGSWESFEPEPSFETDVVTPASSRLRGFDVVTFSTQSTPECSPLSCNYIAREFDVNRFCLLESFEVAQSLVESGVFKNSEPGPYRIFEVHTL